MPAKIVLSDVVLDDSIETRVCAKLVISGPGTLHASFVLGLADQTVDEITHDELEEFRSRWMKWAAIGGLELKDKTTGLLPADVCPFCGSDECKWDCVPS